MGTTRPLGKHATALLHELSARFAHLEYSAGEGGWYYVYRGYYWQRRVRAAQVQPLIVRGLIAETQANVWTITDRGQGAA